MISPSRYAPARSTVLRRTIGDDDPKFSVRSSSVAVSESRTSPSLRAPFQQLPQQRSLEVAAVWVLSMPNSS